MSALEVTTQPQVSAGVRSTAVWREGPRIETERDAESTMSLVKAVRELHQPMKNPQNLLAPGPSLSEKPCWFGQPPLRKGAGKDQKTPLF